VSAKGIEKRCKADRIIALRGHLVGWQDGGGIGVAAALLIVPPARGR
jgi:hypothetical protein